MCVRGCKLREQGVEFYEAEEMIIQHLDHLLREVDVGSIASTDEGDVESLSEMTDADWISTFDFP